MLNLNKSKIMKNISKKKFFLMAVISALCAIPVSADDKTFSNIKAEVKSDALKVEEDFDSVLKSAKADGKKIILQFSGNEWCPPCQMLDKFIVNTKEFAKYANEKLHMVVADFSRYGEPHNKKYAKRYKELAEKFNLRGFPTLIIMSPNGVVIDTIVGLEYLRSPQDLIDRINKAK